MNFRNLLAAGAAAALFAALPTMGRATAPTVLKFANPAPPQGWVTQKGILPWVKKVEAAADGLVEIKVYQGRSLANYRNMYDRILNGVVQIGQGTYGSIAGQFQKTKVAGLPFIAETSGEAALALWRLYASGVIADDYTRVKPLAMFGFGSTDLHLATPVTGLDQLKGMKIFANGKAVGKIVELVGAVPISSNSGDLYEGLSRGLAQGTAFTWPGIEAFKLAPLVPNELDMPFGKTGGYFFMNRQAFDGLPEKAQRAIDRYSGKELTRIMGKTIDAQDDAVRARILARPGQTRHTLSAADTERLRHVLAPLTDEWVAATPDGAKVLAAYRAEIAAIRKGK